MQEEDDDVLRARMNAGRIMAATMTTNATVTAAILNFLDLRVITPNVEVRDGWPRPGSRIAKRVPGQPFAPPKS